MPTTGSGSGEGAPLLLAGEGSTAGRRPGAGPSAPPPAAAPPPPPQDAPGGGSASSYQRSEGIAPLLPAAAGDGDDVESQSQPSLSRSSKSDKSGRSRKKKKKKGGGGDASSSKGGKSGKGKRGCSREGAPQKSVFHLFFDAVRGLAVIASSLMLVMQIWPLVTLYDESTWLQIALRSYLAIFCLSFVLAESRTPFLRRIVAPHHNWVLRGFLYSFVGLIGMEQDLAVKVELATRTSSVLGPDYGDLFGSIFMGIAAWTMIGVGALYTVLGALCMQGWYARLERGHGEKVRGWQQEREAEEDSRRRKEEQLRREKDGEWYEDLE